MEGSNQMALLKTQEHSHDDNSFTLAVAVLAERLASLPKEDKEDLFELTKILFSTDDDEERRSAARAMNEIMEQRPIKLVKVPEPEDVSEKLGKWLTYISGKIREARKAAGMSQAELAEKAGLTQSHVSRLENGDHSPSHQTVKKIADALGIPHRELDPSAGE